MRGRLLIPILFSAAAASATACFAADTGGCQSFAWPLETERALLTGADAVEAASLTTLGAIPDKAIAIKLAPVADVAFAIAPAEKKRDAAAHVFGAVLNFDGAAEAGLYQVTLSDKAWIDVIQDGAALDAAAHTGKSDCEGVRKSVRFAIAKGPFAVQISGSTSPTLKITIRKAE